MKNKHSFQTRLTLSYSILLVLILIMGGTISQLSYRQVQKNQNRQNRLSLYAAITQFDDVLYNMENMARTLREDASFNQMADEIGRADTDFYYTAYLTQLVLKNMSPLEQTLPIRRSFLYFKETDQILSSAEFAPFDFFGKNTLQITKESAHLMRAEFGNSNRWQRLIPMSRFREGNKNFLYIQPINRSMTYSSNKIQVLFCFELDYNHLMQMFSHIDLYDHGYFMACDSYHDVMLNMGGQDPHYLEISPDTLTFTDQIAAASLPNGENMLITTETSSFSGWNWYLVQPYERAYYSLFFYRNLFLAITAAALLIGGILAWLLSVYNAIPYHHLSDELSSQQKLAASLHSLMVESRPALTESYLHKLLEGTVLSNEEFDEITEVLHLNPSEKRYQVLCLEAFFSDFSDDREIPISQQKRTRAMFSQIREAFPDTGYILKIGVQTYGILLAVPRSSDEQESTQEQILRFQTLHSQLLSTLQIRIQGGLGSQSSILSYIWKSFSQAQEAMRVSSQEESLINYGDYQNATDVYYFPEHMSVQLSGYLSAGNREQVELLFDQLTHLNFVERRLSYTQQRWLLSDIRSTLFKKRQQFDEPSAAPSDEASDGTPLLDIIDQQFSEDISLGMLRNIALELCQLFSSTKGTHDAIANIQAYIAEHYADADLSLTSISQEFHLSENYISSLFKKETQENFSAWLIRLRMAKAKELVTDSNIPLSDLYQYLGYTNAAAFRKVFKKTYGVSPKEMREKKG